ncbi:MAG: M56 family metallopeptidase [Lachnospiraceae bacterium]|nr:M56 family metallopeptidase [Lachnospiraceae bacterium]
MNLLQMSFSGAILILAVIVVRAVSINKLPKRTFLALWGIALLRLLIPFSIPSMLSVYSLVNRSVPVRETVSDVTVTDFIPTAQTGQLFIGDNTAQAQMSQSVQGNMHVSVWIIIWCVGIISCAVFFIISYLRWSFEFKTSLPVSDTFIAQWLEEHRLKRPVTIRQSGRIETPLTYGIFHPVILMPEKTDWENKQQLQYILLHEYVHICRFDLAAKLISAFALCIHWFNPMVWVMYILFNRDIELACDECVIRKFGEDSKSEYALTLISMEEKKSGLMPLCNNFSKNAIEERITAVMKIKKSSFAAIIAAVALVASVTTAFATSAITNNKKSDETSVTNLSDDKQSAEIPDADFTNEEYDKLRELQLTGYEGMSVLEYQNKVWELTETVEYQDLLERFSKSEKLYGMKDSDETAYFLFYILEPLTAERWQSREFAGYATADYPQASDNATVEYILTLEILDVDELTVGEYDVSRRIAVEELNHILDGMTISDLRDEEFMQVLLDEEINSIINMCTTSNLGIEIQYTFRPLGELPTEDMEEWLQERQEEVDRTLAPYVPFGLTYQYDFATDDYKMYFEGKEVKSIYDEREGLWIAEHSGSGEGIYDDNAIELIVVYENGEITGLRDVNEQENNDGSVTVTNVSFVSGMGCSDPNCTDATHHHDCPPDCGDYEHHHNCDLDCTIESHHHAYTEHEQEHHTDSATVTNVSFVSGMGCSDPDCTDATHHHDCPIDCGDYEHHHNCGLDCTIASHHHSGTSAVSGTTQHHPDQHHKDNHH